MNNYCARQRDLFISCLYKLPKIRPMKPILALFVVLLFLAACNAPETPADASTFPLKEYVMAEKEAFSYEVVETVDGETWTEYRIRMISGTWLTEQEVDETEWWHWVNIIIPDKVRETESMMIIGGGSRRDTIPIQAKAWMVEACCSKPPYDDGPASSKR